jgi:hypothetical protein
MHFSVALASHYAAGQPDSLASSRACASIPSRLETDFLSLAAAREPACEEFQSSPIHQTRNPSVDGFRRFATRASAHSNDTQRFLSRTDGVTRRVPIQNRGIQGRGSRDSCSIWRCCGGGYTNPARATPYNAYYRGCICGLPCLLAYDADTRPWKRGNGMAQGGGGKRERLRGLEIKDWSRHILVLGAGDDDDASQRGCVEGECRFLTESVGS